MKKLKLKDLSKDAIISREKLNRIVGGSAGAGDTTSVGDSTSVTGEVGFTTTIKETETIEETESDPVA